MSARSVVECLELDLGDAVGAVATEEGAGEEHRDRGALALNDLVREALSHAALIHLDEPGLVSYRDHRIGGGCRPSIFAIDDGGPSRGLLSRRLAVAGRERQVLSVRRDLELGAVGRAGDGDLQLVTHLTGGRTERAGGL